MTTAMAVLSTLKAFPAIGYMAAALLGIGIGPLLTAVVWHFREEWRNQ